jgi:hypothetical protein
LSDDQFVLQPVDSPEADPYNKALYFYEGDRLIVKNRLLHVMEQLNPRDYVDWSGGDSLFHKKFYDPDESTPE